MCRVSYDALSRRTAKLTHLPSNTGLIKRAQLMRAGRLDQVLGDDFDLMSGPAIPKSRRSGMVRASRNTPVIRERSGPRPLGSRPT